MRRGREEDKDLVIKVLSKSADGNHSLNMTQAYIDVLPIGGPTALFPIKCPRTLEELPENLDETHDRSVVDS